MLLMALDHDQPEEIALGQVPRVAGELAGDVVDQAGWTAHGELAIARQREP